MTLTLFDQIATVADALDLGTASARKTGRNPTWPYVPVIISTHYGRKTQSQLTKVAFATRNEALEHAQRHLDTVRADIAGKLADPRYRALREQYGLPRELP